MELVLDEVCKSFGEKQVLKNISFKVESGKTFGYLGRNGSGKTTTIRIAMDIFPADSGQVRIDGIENKKSRVRIGYLPEERGLYPKRLIGDQMVYFGVLRGLSHKQAKKRSKELLDMLEAGDYYNKKLETLSKGNQQKIQLAIAVLNDPDIVILDEPFSGLDPVNAGILKQMVEELSAKGKIVIFSSHQMNYVEEFCDDVCILDKGSIVLHGSLRSIKKTYPRNKVAVYIPDEKKAVFIAELKANAEIMGLTNDIRVSRNGAIILLREPDMKTKLFGHELIRKFDVDGLAVIEPSLEEIFVEKVGGNETVSQCI